MRTIEEITLRAGTRVRAPNDAAHTDRGVVVALPDVAPVALIRLNCGCRAYVPLRRLVVDRAPAPPRCEVAGCPHPRWEGLYCASHPDGARTSGESFEPEAQGASTNPTPSAASGGAIDDRSTQPPAEPVPPRGTGGPRRGAPRTQSPAHHPLRQRRSWPDDLIIARIREWASTYGEPPSATDWDPAQARAYGMTARVRIFQAADGHWPTAAIVKRRFGSWSAGIRAADVTPRAPGRPRKALA